jgi:hypothetical protein
MEATFIILLQLLTAHLLADFIFQPTSWVKSRREKQLRSRAFWKHNAVVGILTYLLLMQWDNWEVPLLIMGSHALIDAVKILLARDNTTAFVLDQLAHVLVILLVWLWMTGGWEEAGMMIHLGLEEKNIWLILLGYLFNTMPLAVLIRYLTARWSNELEKSEEASASTSLSNAGKYIGMVERTLIFTFIMTNELRAIGFLLAAKSVFRFGDLKDSSDRKKTEYILLGSLLSFAASIISGLFIRMLLAI